MYEQFAKVYDHLMGDFDYPAWADYYLALIGRAGAQPARVCDVACGTGSITLELAKRGLSVTGVDASMPMLERAQQKAREKGQMVPFVRQDMRRLSLHRPVDAIVCACDGANYLLTDADLVQFLQAVRDNLVPGGVLAFDISTKEKLMAQAQERFFYEDQAGLTYFWQNQWDEGTQCVQMELCFFLRRADGLYARFDEHQTQRAHETDDVLIALAEQGFTDARAWGDRTFEPPREGERRVHFTAVRK